MPPETSGRAGPTAIIVDDEVNLSAYLRELLVEVWPELRVLGHAANGRQALELVESQHPDIVFLDIHMPGMTGLEVAERVTPGCLVVFVTAFDDYAVQAFEQAAVDYLLKPVAAERLAQTAVRIKARLEDRPALNAGRVDALLEALRAQEPAHPLRWLRVGSGNSVRLVPVDEAVYFKADRKYTSVFTADAEYLIRTSIRDLEEQLDPDRFWRIHRGTIVNAHEIERATRDLRGRYRIELRSRDETLLASNTYAHLFKQM